MLYRWSFLGGICVWLAAGFIAECEEPGSTDVVTESAIVADTVSPANVRRHIEVLADPLPWKGAARVAASDWRPSTSCSNSNRLD